MAMVMKARTYEKQMMNSTMLLNTNSAIAFAVRILNEQQMKNKLDEILSRKEFKGWINPFEAIHQTLSKILKSFSSLSPTLQWIVAGFLTVLLVVLIFYIIITLRNHFLPLEEESYEPKSLKKTAPTKADPQKLKAEALKLISEGKIKQAVRLLYIFIIELIITKGVLPEDENLTGREIVGRLNKKIPEIQRANSLFEIASYSNHQISQQEAKWMVEFITKSESNILHF